MTRAERWIEEHGRYRRSMRCTDFRAAVGTEKGYCTWCDKLLPKGKRAYCSSACSDEVYVRCHPGSARHFVRLRDKKVCAACGFDTKTLTQWKHKDKTPAEYKAMVEELGFPNRPWGRYSFWDMDHVIPVTEGGGMCGLEGLQTLCVPCHKAETKELAGRRAQERKIA